MIRIRSVAVAGLGAVVLLGLAGCQLAVPGQASANPDQFVGVFVTREPVDLSASGGRLYATVGADPGPTGPYIFAGLRGSMGGMGGFNEGSVAWGFPVYDSPALDTTIVDQAIDIGINGGTPGGQTLTISGTLCLPATASGRSEGVVYVNPVYRTPDGRMYMVAGEMISGAYDFGGSGTWERDESYSVTMDGRTTTEKVTVSLKLTAAVVPEYVVVRDMAADDTVLSRTEYAADALPDTLTPAAGTAYIIVESHATPVHGQPAVTYSLINQGDPLLTTLHARADGAIVQRLTNLTWPN